MAAANLVIPAGPANSATRVTALLTAWRDGNRLALDELVPLVDAELRRIARGYLRRERPGHLLQTTALINEVRSPAELENVNWQSRHTSSRWPPD